MEIEAKVGLKTGLAKTITDMFNKGESRASVKLQRALFQCRYGYLRNYPMETKRLLDAEWGALETDLADIHAAMLEMEDSAALATIAHELRCGDSLLLRHALAVEGLIDEWATADIQNFLRDFIEHLISDFTENYNAIQDIAAIPDADAQRHAYATYFSKSLTDEIATYMRVGASVMVRKEAEDHIQTKCLSMLYDGELEALARLLERVDCGLNAVITPPEG